MSMFVLLESKLFSIHSLAMLAGRCTTYPAAIRSMTSFGNFLTLGGSKGWGEDSDR